MTLSEIIEKCSMLRVHEKRCVTNEYGELVFYKRQTAEWNKKLADIFGPAIKPPGVKPTEDDLDLTKDYGGIWVDQTLFKREFGDGIMIAMFWPWSDGIHITLKMAFLNNTIEGGHP
ncbi:MAG: hypothetical protein GTO13_10385 [Proteobacteria bacterium]|nr:hypothetical protein [Pseudomonadota bacterium]